eukprot:c9820_g1_i1.p1 GENE.c9820_g1_i1~~c9820_g1_i1.p1  ORF type:complete len:475 (-),score=86.39 c9820_g1_i1:363-1787(-)
MLTKEMVRVSLPSLVFAFSLFIFLHPRTQSHSEVTQQEVLAQELSLHPKGDFATLFAELQELKQQLNESIGVDLTPELDHPLPECSESRGPRPLSVPPSCGRVFVEAPHTKGMVVVFAPGTVNPEHYLFFLNQVRRVSNISIEFMFAGDDQLPTPKLLAEISRMSNIKMVDMFQRFRRGAPEVIRCRPLRYSFDLLQGIAVLVSSFDHVFVVQSQAIFFSDPEWLFSAPEYLQTGLMVFADNHPIARMPSIPPDAVNIPPQQIKTFYRPSKIQIPLFSNAVVFHKSRNPFVACHAVYMLPTIPSFAARLDGWNIWRWAAIATLTDFSVFDASPSILVRDRSGSLDPVLGILFAKRHPSAISALEAQEHPVGYQQTGELVFGYLVTARNSLCNRESLRVADSGGIMQSFESPDKRQVRATSNVLGNDREKASLARALRTFEKSEFDVLVDCGLAIVKCEDEGILRRIGKFFGFGG